MLLVLRGRGPCGVSLLLRPFVILFGVFLVLEHRVNIGGRPQAWVAVCDLLLERITKDKAAQTVEFDLSRLWRRCIFARSHCENRKGG
jgi:hypothetical protein